MFKILKKLFREKARQVTPQMLAEDLASQAFIHFTAYRHVCERRKIRQDMDRQTQTFLQIFFFTYAITNATIPYGGMSSEEILAFNGVLLQAARAALLDMEIPEETKSWMQDDARFKKSQQEAYDFYYHDIIPPEQTASLSVMMRNCNCDRKNSLIYWTVKIHFRVWALIGNLYYTDPHFEPLWNMHYKMVRGYVTRDLKNIVPILD